MNLDDDDNDDDDDDKDEEEEDDDDNDNIFYVLAARFHKKNEPFGCISEINWEKYRWRLMVAASKLPKEWFGPNNVNHEFIMWYDGTTFFNHHTTGVGLLCDIYIYFLSLKMKNKKNITIYQ